MISHGKVRSRAEIDPHPDVSVIFNDVRVALKIMKVKRDYQAFIDAAEELPDDGGGPGRARRVVP